MNQNIQDQISEYCICLQEWNASYEEYAKSVGLSYTGLSILSTIFRTENCTQKMLCEICFLPKQSVNSVITSFYKKGWISLEELPEDRRNKTIHFTNAGKAYAQGVLFKVREAECKAMERLTEEQRKTLLEITKAYVICCRETMQEMK